MATTPAGPLGRQTAHLAAALTLALLLGGATAHRAGAEDQRPIDTHVSALTQDCDAAGGTASTDWDFDENGDATQAVVSCDGLGDQSWYECTDDSGYGCDGEPSDLTGSGGVHLRPGLPGLLINAPVATPPSDPPIVAPVHHPIASPLTSGGQSTGDASTSGSDGTSDVAPPANDNGGVNTGDPTPPSGAVPGPNPTPKPHKGHKSHGHHHPAAAAQHTTGTASHHHHRTKHGK